MNQEIPALYDLAREICHEAGDPWTDPRTGITYPPPVKVTTETSDRPQLLSMGMLSSQVCVPADWSDDQATAYMNAKHPAGTEHGWVMRRTGDEALAGQPERVACSDREGMVHIMFDC